MSVGAICFTPSSSNGGFWVVLVAPPSPLFFFLKERKKVYANYTQKMCTHLTPTKFFVIFFSICDLHQKRRVHTIYTQKHALHVFFRTRPTLCSKWASHGRHRIAYIMA